jgi:hypothetical protein
MKRDERKRKKELLEKMPYTEDQLNELSISDLKMLASILSINSWQKTKDQLVEVIVENVDNQKGLDLIDERSEEFCEMCGKYVAIRQGANIVDENDRSRINILKLCPSCHNMFDTRLKPRLHNALKAVGVTNLPESWAKSIHIQAIEASWKSPKRIKPTN